MANKKTKEVRKMDKPIQPFEFLTEDQIKVELEKIEAEKKAMLAKQKQTEVKVVANVPKAKINNGDNPFIKLCKRAFNFVKDNVRINISAVPFNKSVKVGDFMPPDLDRINLPAIKTTISAGPLSMEINSDDITSVAEHLKKY